MAQNPWLGLNSYFGQPVLPFILRSWDLGTRTGIPRRGGWHLPQSTWQRRESLSGHRTHSPIFDFYQPKGLFTWREEDSSTRKILSGGVNLAPNVFSIQFTRDKKNKQWREPVVQLLKDDSYKLILLFLLHLVTTSAEISACEANEKLFRLLGSS